MFPNADLIGISVITHRHQIVGYLKLSVKLNELSETCASTPYDTSKIAPFMRTLRLQVFTVAPVFVVVLCCVKSTWRAVVYGPAGDTRKAVESNS